MDSRFSWDFLTKEYVTPRKVRRLKLMLSAKKEAAKVPRKIGPKLGADKEASILADTPSRRDDIREEPLSLFLGTFGVNGDGEKYLPLNLQLGGQRILNYIHLHISTYTHINVYHIHDIIFYQF